MSLSWKDNPCNLFYCYTFFHCAGQHLIYDDDICAVMEV
uniref:Uncharacterized protein n=1 Tax=Arundo donax TaxID=35708 RepID=A0A0A9HU26_ARUDO